MVDPTTLAGLEGANTYEIFGAMLGISQTAIMVIFIVIGIWSLAWKGFALWKASKKKSIPWFVVLLVLNTVGILEILYIFVFSKISFKGKTKTSKPKKKK